MEEAGLSQVRVVLGDSNLNLDLPFGVESHVVQAVAAHPDFDSQGGLYPRHDIGKFSL